MYALIEYGGYFNIALVVFHLLFWRLFNWPETLQPLSSLNRSIMQVMNLVLIFIFAMFAYLSLVHTWELYYTTLGRAVLLSVAVIFLLRALLQVIFFQLKHVASVVLLLAFITALGVGLASSIKGRNPMIDGFGLIAFASLTPMIFVMGYGMVIG